MTCGATVSLIVTTLSSGTIWPVRDRAYICLMFCGLERNCESACT